MTISTYHLALKSRSCVALIRPPFFSSQTLLSLRFATSFYIDRAIRCSESEYTCLTYLVGIPAWINFSSASSVIFYVVAPVFRTMKGTDVTWKHSTGRLVFFFAIIHEEYIDPSGAFISSFWHLRSQLAGIFLFVKSRFVHLNYKRVIEDCFHQLHWTPIHFGCMYQ